jgi:hypothetical protein
MLFFFINLLKYKVLEATFYPFSVSLQEIILTAILLQVYSNMKYISGNHIFIKDH